MSPDILRNRSTSENTTFYKKVVNSRLLRGGLLSLTLTGSLSGCYGKQIKDNAHALQTAQAISNEQSEEIDELIDYKKVLKTIIPEDEERQRVLAVSFDSLSDPAMVELMLYLVDIYKDDPQKIVENFNFITSLSQQDRDSLTTLKNLYGNDRAKFKQALNNIGLSLEAEDSPDKHRYRLTLDECNAIDGTWLKLGGCVTATPGGKTATPTKEPNTSTPSASSTPVVCELTPTPKVCDDDCVTPTPGNSPTPSNTPTGIPTLTPVPSATPDNNSGNGLDCDSVIPAELDNREMVLRKLDTRYYDALEEAESNGLSGNEAENYAAKVWLMEGVGMSVNTDVIACEPHRDARFDSMIVAIKVTVRGPQFPVMWPSYATTHNPIIFNRTPVSLRGNEYPASTNDPREITYEESNVYVDPSNTESNEAELTVWLDARYIEPDGERDQCYFIGWDWTANRQWTCLNDIRANYLLPNAQGFDYDNSGNNDHWQGVPDAFIHQDNGRWTVRTNQLRITEDVLLPRSVRIGNVVHRFDEPVATWYPLSDSDRMTIWNADQNAINQGLAGRICRD